MKNVVISIGNSDNKLTQQEWSAFVVEVKSLIQDYKEAIHFFGGSETYQSWQNVCWWIDIREERLFSLKVDLLKLRKLYNQESVAILEGNTQFI